MPVYVYRRRDGSTFELEERITMDSLVSCPTTGQSVERVMQPFSPRYKGTGFYSTDHRKTTPPGAEPEQRSPVDLPSRNSPNARDPLRTRGSATQPSHVS